MSWLLDARRAAAFVATLMVLLGFAGNAFGHAALIRSSPDDGGMLAEPPARFELSFNEPVSPLVLKLVTPDGSAIALTAALQGNMLSIDAPMGLGNGSYALSWRVVSADGHPIGGALVFSIGERSAGGAPDGAGDVDWPLRVALWAARVLVYAGLFIGVGGAFFTSWIGAAGGSLVRLAGAAMALGLVAAAASPQWLTRPAVFVHGVGIALWAGALIPLGLALARADAQATVALLRFSRAAPFAVAALIAAGVALAVVQVQSIAALWTTAYGNVLVLKLALLLPLFTLAAANRWRLTHPAARGEAAATRMLRRSILIEICLFLAIFAVVATWRFTPPPRSLAQAAAEAATVHIHTEKAMADLTVTPGRTGAATASIVLMTGEFGLLPAKEVTLTLANPAAGIEPITRPATQAGDNPWQVTGLIIPAPGRWSVRIEALISDFEMARLQGEIDIRP